MKEDVEHWIHTCMKCQGTKSIYKKKYRLYKPLPILNGPFESMSIDFMTHFPLWEEKDVILVMVDRFLKLAKFGTIKTTVTTMEIITLFFNNMPEVIVSD